MLEKPERNQEATGRANSLHGGSGHTYHRKFDTAASGQRTESSTEPGRRRGPDAAPCPCRPHPVVPAEGFLREPEGHATPEKGGLREAAGRREAEAWAAVQLGCFKLTACPQRRGNAQDRAGTRALDGGRAASLTCATSCAA